MQKHIKKIKQGFKSIKRAVLKVLLTMCFIKEKTVKLPDGYLKCTSPLHLEWYKSGMSLYDFRKYIIDKKAEDAHKRAVKNWEILSKVYKVAHTGHTPTIQRSHEFQEELIAKELDSGALNFNIDKDKE